MIGETLSRSEQIKKLQSLLPSCSPKMQAQILTRLRSEVARVRTQSVQVQVETSHAAELKACERNIAYWVRNYCYTYDPRLPISEIPFDLFDIQVQFFAWLQACEDNRESGLVEKSRDMGVTFLCAAFALHRWLFRQGYAVGFGSRKLELVDKKGDPDSIFDKIRYMFYRLPDWMQPEGFSERLHDSTGKIVNPATGSSITGEGGDNIGRGGRKSIYFVDESAFLEHPQHIERSLIATTDVRIDVSTPNGSGNPFAERRESGNVRVFRLHYSDDPRKSRHWQEVRKRIIDPVTWAQEYEIDYTASVEGITIPGLFVTSAIDLHLHPKFLAAYPNWLPHGDLHAGLDIAAGGKNKTVLTPRRGIVILPPVVEPFAGLLPTQMSMRCVEECERLQIRSLSYDVNGIGLAVQDAWNARPHALPFSAAGVNSGATPTEEVWPGGKTAVELFRNRRAELYWKLRTRFQKAFEFLNEDKIHPPDEMISIPRCADLIVQLSWPLHHRTNTGLIQIESKDDMAKRGVKSPDYADSLMLSEQDGGTDWTSFKRAATATATASPVDQRRGRVPDQKPSVW